MDEPEDTMSTEDMKSFDSPLTVKIKPKKRSLVERELETSLTTIVTSPVTNGEGMSTSRYGRARRIKNDSEYLHKKLTPDIKSPRTEKSPVKSQSPVYKMHASNSPLRVESPKKAPSETYLESQIENIYQENISLSRFGTEEATSPSSANKFPKVYIRKDLIQKREAEETIILIKNMFSPAKSNKKNSNSHLNNVLERSSERYSLGSGKPQNGYIDNTSVVKTLDFDSKRKKKENRESKSLSKSELFEVEAKCLYQVGDLAWARMGTYPFWPSIVTRDPANGVYVKKKLFGRIERDVIHVTFFGDNGRRGWIVDNMLRKYMGQLEFESARENVTPEDKKKDPRLYAAYFVSEKKQALWNTSVEEAEMLLREPKRLRIDIFNDMLEKSRGARPRPSKSGKITRTDSDVSLSESLYDSLFSEDDGKTDNTDRSRNMTRNKSLDVSDVVTACLDNMAAKTGITKIQRQSHMDRWLQKAKSKTPEKIQVAIKVEKERSSSKRNKKTPCKEVRIQSVYSLRRSNQETQNLMPFQNEHNYSKNTSTDSEDTDNQSVDARGIGIIAKVESLNDKSHNNSQEIGTEGSITDSDDPKGSVDANDTTAVECREGHLDDVKITDIAGKIETYVTNNITSDSKEAKIEPTVTIDTTIDSKNAKEEVINVLNPTTTESKEAGIKAPDVTNDVNIDPEQVNISKVSSQSKPSNNAYLDNKNEEIKDVTNNQFTVENVSKHEGTTQDMTGCEKIIGKREDNEDTKCVVDSEINNQANFIVHKDDTTTKNEHEVDETEPAINNIEAKNTSFDYDSDSSAPLPYSPLSVDLNKDKSRLEELAELMTDQGWNEPEIPTKKEIDNTNDDVPEICFNNNFNSLEEYKNMIADFNNHGRDICDNYNNKVTTGKFISNLTKHQDLTQDTTHKKQKFVLNKINNSTLLKQEINKISTTQHRDNQWQPKPIKEVNLFSESTYDVPTETGPIDNTIINSIDKCNDNLVTDTEMLNGTAAIDTQDKINVIKEEHSTIKENGYHETRKQKDGYDIETASINSEDSVGSKSDNRRKLRSRDKKPENPLENPEFVKYKELRQDAIMDENPELSQKEIVAYLHKTWLYEENLKTDTKKNDDLLHQNFVKGLNKGPDRIVRKKVLSVRLNKLNFYPRTKNKDDSKDDKISSSKETIVSEISDVNKDSKGNSKADSQIAKKIESIEVSKGRSSIRIKNKDTAIKLKIESQIDKTLDNFEESKDSKSGILEGYNNFLLKPKANSPIDKRLDGIEVSALKSKEDIQIHSIDENKDTNSSVSKKIDIDLVSISSDSTVDKFNENIDLKDKMDVISLNSADFDDEKYIGPTKFDEVKKEIVQIKVTTDYRDYDGESIDSEDSETPLIRCKLRLQKSNSKDFKEANDVTIKKEIEADVISINSEDSDVPLGRRKKKKSDKRTLADPEFVKYLELRQDALMDENPQLTHEEITTYLYQTWLYEENSKSDLKKSDELEQSGLVKGLNHNVKHTKKIRRNKIKIEKEIVDDDVIPKEKPKRKILKACYNEEYSDIEDEIEYFEIFKSKNKPLTPKVENGVDKTVDGDNIVEVIDENEDIEVYDEVELYFEDLTKPKPNIFKGLIREKVCEICEKTVNLVKCKGCNGMFHVDCVMEEPKVVEVQVPSRGRKKKKKTGRKPKSLDDSEEGSDQNASLEEIIEKESHTFDAEVLEAELASKMKDMMEATQPQYDSYSSDDGLDWNDTVPGKCEIIDIKLKPRRSQIDYSDFKCKNCQKYDTPVCFVCKNAVSKSEISVRQKCHVAHCNKYYHLECLDHWPQTQFNGGEPSRNNKKINEYFEAIACPRHVCHTCVSDDPRGCKTRFSGDKLAKCVRCPATYHSFTKCLPAGTQILTASHIICPRHYEHRSGKIPCHVNTGWCFICALGGSLICCEYCPTSFHAECLNIKPPEGGYMCEDCETGRLPLYGEMVWVKLGHYRWWPGIVLHPTEIPDNIMAVKHSPGEFVVRFFGQYDHYWVNRGRVFPFQEGDSGRISSQKSKIDAAFTTAMEHAQRACEILKTAQLNDEESLDIASSLLPPHYVKLKVNRPCGSLCGRRLEDPESSLTQCECNPLDEDPCGPYSQCLNRMLLTECGPTCRAADRCNNRAFEKRLYPKLVPYRTPSRGWGLKTLEDIRAGQFVIEYVGELLDEEEFRRRMARMHDMRDENFYFLTLDKERMIDAGPKGNLARFMNHCCEPNCETQKWTVLGDVRVGLFALYDIPANSEVTFNYNLECAGIDKKRCMCGAKRCSGYIGAKPKQDDQSKKPKLPGKRTHNKKRKNTEESPSTSDNKPKRPKGRPPKPRELTEIEKDLLIIKNATNGLSSDESSRSLSLDDRNPMALKRKRVSFSTEEVILYNGSESPSAKKHKPDCDKSVGD